MLKSYLKIALRNFYRNKVFVLINALGLGVALACCIVAYLNYDFSTGFNLMHVNKDKIYNVSITKEIEGQPVEYGISPITLGPVIKAEMGDLRTCRCTRGTGRTVPGEPAATGVDLPD